LTAAFAAVFLCPDAAEYAYSKNKLGHIRKPNPFEMNSYVPELSCGKVESDKK